MKKLLLVTIIAISTAFSAKAQFFWGLQFGFYVDGLTDTYSGNGETVRGGSSFNYMLKPKIGYYITPKLVTGLSIIYTSNSFAENQSGEKATQIKNYFINLLMGNGLDANAMSWRVSPYIRYEFLEIAQGKVKFWAELSGYAGTKYPWDNKQRRYLKEESQSIYGVSLHPLISVDIADKWMLFTNLDILSIEWEGSTSYTQVYSNDSMVINKKTTSGTFLFQSRPTIALAHLFSNIGLIKKF
ncbi:MAG: hypothetical protein MJY89_07610 [Bacteroidales bacterium]|nr:hypothetical protein [Bacteroidales bacterium]